MAFESIDLQIQTLLSQVTELEQANHRLSTQCNNLQAELTDLRSRSVREAESRYESLQKSESRYRQLFEYAPISMLLINTDGYFTAMNAAAEAFFGLPIDQMNQHVAPIFGNPQLVENGTLPYILRAFAGEAIIEPPSSYDSSRDVEGGKLDYGQGHYAPIRNATGGVEEIVEITADMNLFFALQEQLLQEKDRAAQERAELLSTVAQVANLLLRSPDYTTVLPDVVRLLGEAVGSDRCAIGQNILHPVSGKSAAEILPEWEWCKTGVEHSDEFSPHLDQLFLWEDDAPYTYEQLLQGNVVNSLVNDLPELDHSLLAVQGNTAELFVPILVNHQCWGFIAFDNCGEARLYDEAEIAIHIAYAPDSLIRPHRRIAKHIAFPL